MNLKFSASPQYKKPNNTKYFAIQLVADECKIGSDRDIAEHLGLVTKVYRNMLRKFNAKMKFEKDTNIVFETIEELYEATKYLEQKFNGNESIKFRRTETGEGYIYGECTNEFVKPYKNLVPTITFEEIFENSLNKIKTDWDLICKYFMLDETLMDECPAEKLNWNLISRYQNMSLDFIEKHKDYLKLEILSLNVKLSKEIKDEVIKMMPTPVKSKAATSSDVNKEILGQMLGLNEEQLSRIGQVIQVGGPDEEDGEIELGLDNDDKDKKIVFGFMNENNEKEYLLQLNCTLDDFEKLGDTDAFNNFVSNLEDKYGTLDAGNLGDDYDTGFSSSEITGKNIKKLMQEFEDYFKSIGIID